MTMLVGVWPPRVLRRSNSPKQWFRVHRGLVTGEVNIQLHTLNGAVAASVLT
jgi:hypothetical protein